MTPWTIVYQAPLSIEFSRQGYWSGLPSPSPGDLPDPGIEPRSSALQANSLPSKLQGVVGVCTQLCLTLCNLMDCSPLQSMGTHSVHGVFQARILEWVAISFSRGSSQPKDWTCISCISCISCIGRQTLSPLCHLGSPIKAGSQSEVL